MEIVTSAKYIAAALALIPLAGVGIALGHIFGTAISVIGRNPGSKDQVFPVMILSFALTEAIALFALLISFLILFI
ncbi:MAG: ATP synthase subunit C family protein [Rhodospirillaceae bacterium]